MKGWKIHNTKLSAQFSFKALQEKYGGQAIPFFAVKPKGGLEVFTVDAVIKPLAGWTLIYMAPTDDSSGDQNEE